MRDEFTKEVKRTLAERVGYRCSNPSCRALTSGPQVDPAKSLNAGVAAHITAASPGGARYSPKLSPKQRRHPDNGIWLCQNCAKLVDNDEDRFTEEVLREWKHNAEKEALAHIGKTAGAEVVTKDDRPINVISYKQSGGITAYEVDIYQPPPPALHVREEVYFNKLSGGKYLTRIRLSLVSQYPVGNLHLKVSAKTIESMKLSPMRTGMFMLGHSGKRQGYAFTNVPNAFGDYQLDVVSTQPERFEIEYDIA